MPSQQIYSPVEMQNKWLEFEHAVGNVVGHLSEISKFACELSNALIKMSGNSSNYPLLQQSIQEKLQNAQNILNEIENSIQEQITIGQEQTKRIEASLNCRKEILVELEAIQKNEARFLQENQKIIASLSNKIAVAKSTLGQ